MSPVRPDGFVRNVSLKVGLLLVGIPLLVLILWDRLGGRAPPAEDPYVRFVLLHTNDVHGNLLPHTPALALVEAKGPVGGVAALASFVGRERAAAQASGAHVLLLDGGDVFRGTPEGDLTKGDLVVEALGRLRYDAVAVGNHEFDFGLENFQRLVRAAPFPWISANITDRASGTTPTWLQRHVVVERGGIRFGIVGMTPPDTEKLVFGGSKLGLRFEDEVASAREAAEELAGRMDVLLFVTHLGPERDRRILDAVPACRLVVGGHSHTRLARPIPAGPGGRSWIVQAGTACVVAGRVAFRVHRQTKDVLLDDAGLVPLAEERVGRDAPTAAFLTERLGSIPELARLSEPIAVLATDLSRDGATSESSSPAGNAFADAMRTGAGTRDGNEADVALANRGGIRVRLPKGPVSGRDLFLLMPFDNTLVEVPLLGAELRGVIETSLRGPKISPLEVSGIVVRWVREGTGEGAPVRITRFEVGGKPLDDAATYRVIVNSFLAQGGDGYAGLAERPGTKDLGILVRDALRAHFAKAAVFEPDATERMGPERRDGAGR